MTISRFLQWWLQYFVGKCCKFSFWTLQHIAVKCTTTNDRILMRWQLANENQERLWNHGYRRNTRRG